MKTTPFVRSIALLLILAMLATTVTGTEYRAPSSYCLCAHNSVLSAEFTSRALALPFRWAQHPPLGSVHDSPEERGVRDYLQEPRKILILSVPAGSGHVIAEKAIQEALHRTDPAVQTEIVHVTDFMWPLFRWLYIEGYRIAVDRLPFLWGWLYNFWDSGRPDSGLTSLLNRFQRFVTRSFFEYLKKQRPDAIITTHFLPPQLLDVWPIDLPRIPFECVITDYGIYSFWLSKTVSRYYVGHPHLIAELTQRGISAERVIASGIPTHPAFAENSDNHDLYKKLDLDPNVPVILMLGGGMGMTWLTEAVRQILTLPGPLQVITVSGRNETLLKTLNQIQPPDSIRLLNLGWVDYMPLLMKIAFVAITKPGGLTISECLVTRILMILFKPIPGQEEGNAKFLADQGAALMARSVEDLTVLLTRLLSEPELREQLRRGIQDSVRPHAAFTIARHVLNDVGSPDYPPAAPGKRKTLLTIVPIFLLALLPSSPVVSLMFVLMAGVLCTVIILLFCRPAYKIIDFEASGKAFSIIRIAFSRLSVSWRAAIGLFSIPLIGQIAVLAAYATSKNHPVSGTFLIIGFFGLYMGIHVLSTLVGEKMKTDAHIAYKRSLLVLATLLSWIGFTINLFYFLNLPLSSIPNLQTQSLRSAA